jgi:hypothetical protein
VLLLHAVLIILHVIFAAAWFGMSLRLTGQARTALGAAPGIGQVLANDGAKTVKLMGAFLVLTFVFGFAALALRGFAMYAWPIHTAVTLLIIMIAVHFFLIAPGWKSVQAAATGVGQASHKRIAAGLGISHLLWLITLIFMFWPRLEVGFRALTV